MELTVSKTKEDLLPTVNTNTQKSTGTKLKLLPSVFSLYFVSLINYDDMDIEDENKIVKASWLALNKRGNESVQDIFAAKYLLYVTSLWTATMFIIIVLWSGTMEVIRECNPINQMFKPSGSTFGNQPFAILIAIFYMNAGMHSILLPEVKGSLNMMKFALNHPERFHSWKRAALCGLFRFLMLISIEIVQILRIIGRCEVMLVVTGFVSFTALIEVDNMTFFALGATLPFKQIIMADDSEKPDKLTIDVTTS